MLPFSFRLSSNSSDSDPDDRDDVEIDISSQQGVSSLATAPCRADCYNLEKAMSNGQPYLVKNSSRHGGFKEISIITFG